jgi:tetratricopeptide (TPR) repeat protein
MRIAEEHLRAMAAAGRLGTGRVTVSLPQESVGLLVRARSRYTEALAVLPADFPADAAVIHHQLAGIHQHLADIPKAHHHFREAIRLHEITGDRYRAAQSHQGLANLILHRGGRLGTALSHARTALRYFEALGPRAAPFTSQARSLVEEIERLGA